jgi:hypothetical protein
MFQVSSASSPQDLSRPLTDTIVPKVVDCRGNILGISFPRSVGGAPYSEAGCIPPTSNGHAYFSVGIKQRTNLTDTHEWFIVGPGGEDGRVGKGGDSMCHTSCD